MYVRWKRRERRFATHARRVKVEIDRRTGRRFDLVEWADGILSPEVHWSAVLVENVRVGGKPRQKHVAYLVGFTESQAAVSLNQRVYIWDIVNERLDRLSNRVSAVERVKVEAAIAARVAKPSQQEVERVRSEVARFLAEGFMRRHEEGATG